MTDADIDRVDGALTDLRRARMYLRLAQTASLQTVQSIREAEEFAERCLGRFLAEVRLVAMLPPIIPNGVRP